mgnify:FL=1|tara:strand:+ start:1941 stop:3128 length:1188 start_codon:yes stop_codon:yes gene_type:complete
MKIKLFTILSIVLFAAGCQMGSKQSTALSDAELVQMIIDSEKEQIDISELPVQSLAYIENDIEYDEIGTNLANGLGYEVKRIGNGFRSGHRNEVYFNLDGRRLDPTDWNGRRPNWKNVDDFSEKRGQGDWRCFYLVFPVTFEMPDGSTITVETDDESGWSDLKSWYDNSGAVIERPSIQYPVDIIFKTEESETTITIDNAEEMNSAKEECREAFEENQEWDVKRCFVFVFPITFEMPDGSTITVETDDESGWSVLESWYNNDENEAEPSLQYPVDIVLETEEGEETVTINSEGDMNSVEEACRGELEEYDEENEVECFEYVFPITFEMPDGSTITVEDEEGWFLLRRWYEENIETDGEPSLQYPVDIILETEDGESTLTINNGAEMDAVYDNCQE